MKTILLATIRFYRAHISPLFPSSCRFVPTCSQYGIMSIEKYGVLFGLVRLFFRILRCHRLHPGGWDPA